MRPIPLAGLSGLLALAGTVRAVNFPFESVQLAAADAANFSAVAFGDASAPLPASSTSAECRAFPGSTDWPSDADWAQLNSSAGVGGALLKPLPPGAVCYPSQRSVYSLTKCLALLFGAFTTRFYIDDPLTVLTSWPQGDTCPPALFPRGNCTQGGFPVYVVNVTTVRQIQAAVNFARNKNVRLVIKNTGHDFVGRSTGAGALSVWTHHLKQFEFLPSYKQGAYEGMAARVASGLEAWELYAYMDQHSMTLVVPGGQTVGAYGGWTAGGGHSALGSLYGMGSDQVLAFEVVTADGRFITADPDTNADLFYALRGGGPGTFGIVTSAIVKAYPPVYVAEQELSFSAGPWFQPFNFSLPLNHTGPFNFTNPYNFTNPFNLSNPFNNPFNFTIPPPTNYTLPPYNFTRPPYGSGNATGAIPAFNFTAPPAPVVVSSPETFWEGVAAYFRFGKTLCDAGGTGYSYVSGLGNGSFSFSTTFELPGMTDDEAMAFLQPVYDSLRALGIRANNTRPATSLSWGPGARRGEGDSPGGGRFGTRLFPRANWADDTVFNATMAAIRNAVEAGYAFHGVQVAPRETLAAARYPGNDSVNPAFRNALMHADLFDRFSPLSGATAAGAAAPGTSRNGSRSAGPASALNATALALQSRAQFESYMDTLRAVTPGSGAYVNEADPDEPGWQASFWGDKYAGLLRIKRARDPWGLFWAPTTVGSEAWEVRSADGLGTQNGRLCRVQ